MFYFSIYIISLFYSCAVQYWRRFNHFVVLSQQHFGNEYYYFSIYYQ